MIHCGQPNSVHFIYGQLQKPVWPCLEALGHGASGLRIKRCIATYDISAGRFVNACDINIGNPENDIMIVTDVRFEEGNVVTASTRPQPFDEFCAPFLRSRGTKASKTGGARKKIPPSVREKVKAEFPWLSDQELNMMLSDASEETSTGGKHIMFPRRLIWQSWKMICMSTSWI